MSDIRDPHPDSPPEHDDDRRTDIEQAIDRTPEDVEHAPEADGDPTPLEPTDRFDGTGGAIKNEDPAQP